MLQYWRFYWPLALTGVAMVLSVQFQNAALARYPEAVTELAVYALGYGAFGFFRASLNFIAQLTTVFARSVRRRSRRCQRYVFGVSVLIMLPLIYLGHSEGGAWLLAAAFGTEPAHHCPGSGVPDLPRADRPAGRAALLLHRAAGAGPAHRLGDDAQCHLPGSRHPRPDHRLQLWASGRSTCWSDQRHWPSRCSWC